MDFVLKNDDSQASDASRILTGQTVANTGGSNYDGMPFGAGHLPGKVPRHG